MMFKMAALMTSMRVKQFINLTLTLEKAKVCGFCWGTNNHFIFSLHQGRFIRGTGLVNIHTKRVNDDQKDQNDAKQPKYIKWFYYGAAAFGAGLCFYAGYTMGSPDTDAKGKQIEDEFSDSPVSYLKRAYKRLTYEVQVTREPSRQKLLPDPLTYPYLQPKYTLVIEMTDVLVHPDWTYKTGWRFKKRPGIDVFLRAVGPPLFEVVIFTREQGMTADPIITKADPENFIMYRLYRDATRYEDGVHIKDLRYLNRDLSKVIMIDWDKQALRLNPENGFFIKKWDGGNSDTVLGELAEFLRAIAASNVDDVRPVLQYYSQFDDPLGKFHENQVKVKEEQQRQAKVLKQQTEKSLTGMTSFWRKR